MIWITVDEAEAFDRYSILWAKYMNGLGRASIPQLEREICAAIPNWREVGESPEYRELLKANAAVFDAIELAAEDKISAREVQVRNHRRFLAKKALQERFWPNNPISEVKTPAAMEVDTPAAKC